MEQYNQRVVLWAKKRTFRGVLSKKNSSDIKVDCLSACLAALPYSSPSSVDDVILFGLATLHSRMIIVYVSQWRDPRRKRTIPEEEAASGRSQSPGAFKRQKVSIISSPLIPPSHPVMFVYTPRVVESLFLFRVCWLMVLWVFTLHGRLDLCWLLCSYSRGALPEYGRDWFWWVCDCAGKRPAIIAQMDSNWRIETGNREREQDACLDEQGMVWRGDFIASFSEYLSMSTDIDPKCCDFSAAT